MNLLKNLKPYMLRNQQQLIVHIKYNKALTYHLFQLHIYTKVNIL